jgi:hypothetical protein
MEKWKQAHPGRLHFRCRHARGALRSELTLRTPRHAYRFLATFWRSDENIFECTPEANMARASLHPMMW